MGEKGRKRNWERKSHWGWLLPGGERIDERPWSYPLYDYEKLYYLLIKKSSKINDFHVLWKPICDFLLMINSNLGHISHHLATIHSWQTTDRQSTTRTISSTVT